MSDKCSSCHKMTIDDATLYMELYKRKLFNSVSDLEKDIEAYDIAIKTMRKYQKIVNIVSLNDEEFKQCGLKELKEILEVIADGNDN